MEISTNYYDSYVLELVCKINLFSSKRRRLYSRQNYDAYETLLGEIGRLEPLLRTGNTQMYNRLVGIPKFGLLVYGYVNLFAEPFCGIYFSLKGVDCIHHKYTILMQYFRVKLELWTLLRTGNAQTYDRLSGIQIWVYWYMAAPIIFVEPFGKIIQMYMTRSGVDLLDSCSQIVVDI